MHSGNEVGFDYPHDEGEEAGCPACGEAYADCTCEPYDPFLEEETEEEAMGRMTPDELAADRAYLEGRR
jgi:hypothetical protein